MQATTSHLKLTLLLLGILFIFFLGPYLPIEIKQIFYAISLTIKSFIIFLLPLIIFSLLFRTMITMAQRATIIIFSILLCVSVSNFFTTFLSHYIGQWIYHFNLALITPHEEKGLLPAWTWEFPSLIANNKAMFTAIILGILFGLMQSQRALRWSERIEKYNNILLTMLTYLIPFFVLGYLLKLQQDGVFTLIISDYAKIFIVIFIAQFCYILFCYAALNHFKFSPFIFAVKNMLPAALAGLTTMSSASVMPLSIRGVQENAKNKHLASAVVPATVNIHLLGDCIAIPIFAYAVMKSFGFPEPTLLQYSIFVCYFVLAKFSVAAIPGGGIIVMLPILENYLGFNGSMLSLITALYILFDPVITCANIFGNGAFALLVDKLSIAAENNQIEEETIKLKI